jgi:hypothetical protein
MAVAAATPITLSASWTLLSDAGDTWIIDVLQGDALVAFSSGTPGATVQGHAVVSGETLAPDTGLAIYARSNGGTAIVSMSQVSDGGGGVGGGGDASAANQTTMIASLSVMDDWDETDRAKVNPIVGQAGVAAGAGPVSATVQRHTLASDDPAVTVLGAQADAASASTSIKGALRGIATALGITALDLGAGTGGTRTIRTMLDSASTLVLAAGTALVGKFGIDQTTPGTTNAVAPISGQAGVAGGAGAITALTQRVVPASDTTFGYTSTASFTPAAASHVGNDVVGGAQSFASIGPSAGLIRIIGATLEIDNSSAEATAWRLHLYNVTPTSAIADDGAWNYADTDRSQYLGYVDLPSTATDLGSNQWAEADPGKTIRLSGTGVWGYLTNLTTLTPGAVVHKVTLHAVSI